MIEFQHLITQSEVDSQYINLTDESGRRFGKQIGKPDKVLPVIDDAGKHFEMRRLHGNQLTRCTAWFTERGIIAGALVTIRFDPQTATIHLLLQPPRQPASTVTLGSVSFQHDGDHYEVRCIADGEVVRVCGLRDGKQVSSFDFPPTPRIRKRRIDISEFV